MKTNLIQRVTVSAGLAFAAAAQSQMEITRSTTDGGGVISSTGSDFELSGTIGQPDAGVLVGGGLTLTGGFWFETPPGDCNSDGVVGLLDVDAFVNCLTGPLNGIEAGCECFDVNRSGAIDLADFSENQRNTRSE